MTSTTVYTIPPTLCRSPPITLHHIAMLTHGPRSSTRENLVTKPSEKYGSLTAVVKHLPGMSKQRDVRR